MKLVPGEAPTFSTERGTYEVELTGELIIQVFQECSTGYRETDHFDLKTKDITGTLDLNDPDMLYTTVFPMSVNYYRTIIEYILFEENGKLFASQVQPWEREDWAQYISLRQSGLSPRAAIEFINL